MKNLKHNRPRNHYFKKSCKKTFYFYSEIKCTNTEKKTFSKNARSDFLVRLMKMLHFVNCT